MARKAHNQPQPPGYVRCYVPDLFDNKADPEPVRVYIRNPTQAQKRNFHRNVRMGLKVGDGGAVTAAEVRSSGDEWKRAALEDCVERVENYSRQDTARDAKGQVLLDENGEPVTQWVPIVNGADLYEHGEPEFVEDVALEVIGAFSLTEAEKKRSETSSDSTPADTKASGGTAADAERKDSTRCADAAQEQPLVASAS